MPPFGELPRAILLAVSRASGPEARDVDGTELLAELRAGGYDYEPDSTALHRLMGDLRDDGFLSFHGSFGEGIEGYALIRLGTRGRQEIEGWPRDAGGLTPDDAATLLALVQARAADPRTPEDERRKLDALSTAGRDLGVQVLGDLMSAWLRAHGVP